VFFGHGPIKAEDKIVPTGSMILDASAGVGGLPGGRIVEIFGPEASGKSTLCLSIVAEAQKKGMTCAYIDTEHALDAKYAKKLGVNVDSLILSQPDFAEQALDIFKEVAASGAIDVIVLDSVAALVPKAELEGETADQSMGVQARMMSKMLRVLAGVLNKNNCLGIFINQVRMKIGVMYGNPETTPGGNALKFYASMRMRVSRGETFGGEPAKGHMINVKFVKNKMAPPFTECQVPLVYGQGIDQAGDLFTIAKEWGVLDVRGAHSYFNGQKFASSRDEAVAKLKSDKAAFAELDKAVREELKKRQASGEVSVDENEDPEMEE
jgi:recombination protein RecA